MVQNMVLIQFRTMPSFSPMGTYNLTAVQVDLILYCLDMSDRFLTIQESNEKRKILESLHAPTEKVI